MVFHIGRKRRILMFDNIGEKMMKFAIILCGLGIIASVIYGIVLLANSNYNNNTTGLGIAVIIGGSLFSWIGSWALYAFGQITDDIHAMCEHRYGFSSQSNTSTKERVTTQNLENLINARKVPEAQKEASNQTNFRSVEQDGWQCICGRVNPSFASTCSNCHLRKQAVMERKHPTANTSNE